MSSESGSSVCRERLGQRFQLGLHVARQLGEDVPRLASGDQPVEHATPIDAEDVRQYAAELDARRAASF